MSKVIAVNSGSSSLKFQLFQMPEEKVLASGIAERIGIHGSNFAVTINGEKFTTHQDIPNHDVAVSLLLESLVKHGVVKSLDEIEAAGHRIVQGGAYFKESVLVDEDVVSKVDELSELAPLHNPGHLICYHAFKHALPHIRHVFVFDTAFHQTMPEEAYLYGIPYRYYEQYRIRRYGFHGTSHDYVSKRAAAVLGRPVEELKLIVCHLGNGASVSAVKYGKCVDTSMGLTPLEGLIMGTRSGDVDPAVIEFIAHKEGKSIEEITNMLNKESGVLGLSDGFSSDFRDLEDAWEKEKNPNAARALKAYALRTAKYVGAYAAAMNGVDAVCFTAGVGENSPIMRTMICGDYLGYLGITLDEEANAKRGKDMVISTPESATKVLVIPTNEELAIARQTYALIK